MRISDWSSDVCSSDLLWLAGLAWLAFARRAACWRGLAWLYVTALMLFWLAGARDYYLAPAYPMLLAVGAVLLEHCIAGIRPRAATAARIATAAVLLFALADRKSTRLNSSH